MKFGKDKHAKVVDTSRDVPEMPPDFPLELTEVGICSKTVWIILPGGRLPFNAEITVSLPADKRGIHMSRIEGIISKLHDKRFTDIRNYALEACREILSTQEGNQARIKLKGRIPRIETSPVTEKISIDTMEISTDVSIEENDGFETIKHCMIGLTVTHITACPCTQFYNQALFEIERSSIPMPTHSQRCITTIEIEDVTMTVNYDDLLSCISIPIHTVSDLLKRPDEAELVLACHERPQFAEDVVRAIARECAIRFQNRLPADSKIRISSLSLESIHQHDVICRLECSLKDIEV